MPHADVWNSVRYDSAAATSTLSLTARGAATVYLLVVRKARW